MKIDTVLLHTNSKPWRGLTGPFPSLILDFHVVIPVIVNGGNATGYADSEDEVLVP